MQTIQSVQYRMPSWRKQKGLGMTQSFKESTGHIVKMAGYLIEVTMEA